MKLNKFRVEPVFIYENGLLLPDIIIEEMQHAKSEFLYEDYDIKSAKILLNLDTLRLLGQAVLIFFKFTQDEEVRDLLVVLDPPCVKKRKVVNAFEVMKNWLVHVIIVLSLNFS